MTYSLKVVTALLKFKHIQRHQQEVDYDPFGIYRLTDFLSDLFNFTITSLLKKKPFEKHNSQNKMIIMKMHFECFIVPNITLYDRIDHFSICQRDLFSGVSVFAMKKKTEGPTRIIS